MISLRPICSQEGNPVPIEYETGKSQNQSGLLEEEKNPVPLTEFKPRTIQLVV